MSLRVSILHRPRPAPSGVLPVADAAFSRRQGKSDASCRLTPKAFYNRELTKRRNLRRTARAVKNWSRSVRFSPGSMQGPPPRFRLRPNYRDLVSSPGSMVFPIPSTHSSRIFATTLTQVIAADNFWSRSQMRLNLSVIMVGEAVWSHRLVGDSQWNNSCVGQHIRPTGELWNTGLESKRLPYPIGRALVAQAQPVGAIAGRGSYSSTSPEERPLGRPALALAGLGSLPVR
jgi:hypothetical protein